ncbi:MAG TPA: tetratricopeptide repeat protein [Gallionella sp.]|nr:tetratricopeptide repeat protein [Gallionella sp.]
MLGIDVCHLLYAAGTNDLSTAPPSRTTAANPAPRKTMRPVARPPGSAAPRGTPAQAEPQESIRQENLPHITRKQTGLVEPLLQEAYSAYRSGELEQAQRLYLGVVRKDVHNSDALLGLAAVALQHGDNFSAAQYYSRVLEADPRNSAANAGLAALSADDGANESHLKILLHDQPNSAVLHFALGNLYARQMRWSEARQAYFSAYTLDAANAAFAFNLAVSLDHLGEHDLAAFHYRQAVQLDPSNNAGLDHAHITQRIDELGR